MKRWKAPDNHGGYMVYVREGFNTVVPMSDIKPHDIYTAKCQCNPRSSIDDETLHIIHESFEEKEALDNAMNNLNIDPTPS